MTLKEQLYQICLEKINERINNIQQKLDGIEEARNKAVKSSAGDKFETDRAMMQMKEEESNAQLIEAINVKRNLQKIQLMPESDRIQLGSIVQTNKGRYYLSIGIGKVNLEDQLYYCISTQSPIGQMLLNKEKGNQFTFNGNTFSIKNIY